MVRGGQLVRNYPQLQALIRRDAASYCDEFEQQWASLIVSLASLADGAPPADDTLALVAFAAHTAPLYGPRGSLYGRVLLRLLGREETYGEFDGDSDPSSLVPLGNAHSLNAAVREAAVTALLVLRKQRAIPAVPVLEVLLRLLEVRDKSLREHALAAVVGEVVRANARGRDHALNSALQAHIHGLLCPPGTQSLAQDADSEHAAGVALRLVHVLAELFRRGPWADARTANIVADAAARLRAPRPLVAALEFFLGRYRGGALVAPKDENDDDADEGAQARYKALLVRTQIAGKTRAAKRKLKRELGAVHRAENRGGSPELSPSAPLMLLHDPQAFAERLFASLKRTNASFEVKLLYMDVVTRAVGAHGLVLPELYSFLQRYLTPHQRDVTRVLAFVAQAAHALAPPDAVACAARCVARAFAAEYCSPPVIAAGLNGVVAVLRRCPAAIAADDATADMLNALVATFRGASDKGVLSAVRGLVALMREECPLLLHRRERGKDVSVALASGGLSRTAPVYGRAVVLDASLPAAAPGALHGGRIEPEPDTESGGESDEGFDTASDGDTESASDEPTRKSSATDIVRLATQRPLTPKELVMLRRRTLGLDAQSAVDSSSASEDDDGPADGAVDPKSLESAHRGKSDREARLAAVRAGREGRLAFGSRRGKHTEGGMASVANAPKAKRNKNPIMLAHKASVRAKRRRSGKEAQEVAHKHAQRQRMRR